MADVIVYKERTNIIQVDLGIDVTGDIFTSEIREEKNSDSTLIATWDVNFLSDGSDGKIVLRLDDSVLLSVTQKVGYMDMKRVSAGEPYPVFATPIRVRFNDQVTE